MTTPPAVPEDLDGLLMQSVISAKTLQSRIARLDLRASTSLHDSLWANVVAAHSQNVLNHTSIIAVVAALARNEDMAGSGNDNGVANVLATMSSAAEQMIKDSRSLTEYVVLNMADSFDRQLKEANAVAEGLKAMQFNALRGGHRKISRSSPYTIPRQTPAAPDAGPRQSPAIRSRTPTGSVERADATQQQTVQPDLAASGSNTERNIKEAKKRKKQKSHEHASTAIDSPSTHHNMNGGGDASNPTQKKSPAADLAAAEKRKSDVSMIDAPADSPAPPPPKKLKKKHSKSLPTPSVTETPEPFALSAPQRIEYEDISAEVDARVAKTQARIEREKKREKGIVEKRKRLSAEDLAPESDTVEKAAEDGRDGVGTERRVKKRKKHRHSGVEAVAL